MQRIDWRVVQSPLHAVREAGLWTANRSIFRRPAKRLLARWPALRWRIWRFLLVTPGQDDDNPFVVGSRNGIGMGRDKEAFKMFAMSEPRKPIDVEGLKARIQCEGERQKIAHSKE
jgi:hypothetical protein